MYTSDSIRRENYDVGSYGSLRQLSLHVDQQRMSVEVTNFIGFCVYFGRISFALFIEFLF